MHTEKPFHPRGLLKHPHTQSMLASFKLRRWFILNRFPQLKTSTRIILETSEGKLAADINQHPNPKGHAVLLHGWEGCSNSVYLVSLGTYLYKRGYSVSRLNLRDHGNTYHLNEGPFHGLCLLEVAEATKQLCESYGSDTHNLLAGFSMGGNFSLRIASLAKDLEIPLDAVFAVSPAVRPLSTMKALAKGPKLYHHYFRKKWRRSIQAKQAAWSELYDFNAALKLETLDEMTDFFVDAGLLPANSAESYLEGYRVSEQTIENITVPTFIL
ncbi:MAG: alpha/beta fold hydrolase, partial [Gammaproteobacteria bacterium]|nr:alpha/beta fold hydrolase [Gammaproteobacteria bacterium]